MEIDNSSGDSKLGKDVDAHRRKILSLVKDRIKKEEASIQRIENFIAFQEDLFYTSKQALQQFIEKVFYGETKNGKEPRLNKTTVASTNYESTEEINMKKDQGRISQNNIDTKDHSYCGKFKKEENYIKFLSGFCRPFSRTKETLELRNSHQNKRRKTDVRDSTGNSPTPSINTNTDVSLRSKEENKKKNRQHFIGLLQDDKIKEEIKRSKEIENEKKNLLSSILIDWEPVSNKDYAIKITVSIPRKYEETTKIKNGRSSGSSLNFEDNFVNMTVSSPNCTVDCRPPLVSLFGRNNSSSDNNLYKDNNSKRNDLKNRDHSATYYQQLQTIAVLNPFGIFQGSNNSLDFSARALQVFPSSSNIDSQTVIELTIGGLYQNKKSASRSLKHVLFGKINVDLIDLLGFETKRITSSSQITNSQKMFKTKFYPEYVDLYLSSKSTNLRRYGTERVDNCAVVNWSHYINELMEFFRNVNEDRRCNTKFCFHVISSGSSDGPISSNSLSLKGYPSSSSSLSSMELRLRLYGVDSLSLYLGSRLLRTKIDSLDIPVDNWINISDLEDFSAHVNQFWKTLSLLKQETVLLLDSVKKITLKLKKDYITKQKGKIDQRVTNINCKRSPKEVVAKSSNDLCESKNTLKDDDNIPLDLIECKEEMKSELPVTDIVAMSGKVDKSLLSLFDTVYTLHS